jgi:hypothetical protein
MATFHGIRWVRILVGGVLAEGCVLTFILGSSIFFAQHSFRYAASLATMQACFLFAFWVGLRVDANFALHGALLGVVVTLIQAGATLGTLNLGRISLPKF